MNELKEIDTIIHLGYSVIGLDGVGLHPRQEELRRLWLARIQSQSKRGDYLALYFPSKYRPNLYGGLDENEYQFEVAEEVDRIKQYRSILGDKLIVLKGGILPLERRGWERLIRRHGFYFDTDELRINAFGEMYEVCVAAWSSSLRYTLGLSKDRLKRIRKLSIDYNEFREFEEWQYEKLRKAA